MPSESSIAAARAHVDRVNDTLHDLDRGYPANEAAYPTILAALDRLDARRVVEIGVGDGNAIPVLTAAGVDVVGIDIDAERVESSRARMADFGLDPDQVASGDITEPSSYSAHLPDAGFDALIAFGVLPHVQDEVQALRNMRSLVRPGGEVFVECRNKLFSLITFNRYTSEFILEDLLGDTPMALHAATEEFLAERVNLNVPPPPSGHAPTFHNPFEVPDLFETAGFTDIEVVPFHYHATMPALERSDPQQFRDASLAMEGETSGWRGLFLCSAFLVHGRRDEA